MTATRHPSRITALTAAALTALVVTAAPAAAAPKPTGQGSRQTHTVDAPTACAAHVRALTIAMRKAGLAGHPSHNAAELTLHC